MIPIPGMAGAQFGQNILAKARVWWGYCGIVRNVILPMSASFSSSPRTNEGCKKNCLGTHVLVFGFFEMLLKSDMGQIIQPFGNRFGFFL
jgi:hypothetical protein